MIQSFIDRPTTDDDRLDAPGGDRALRNGCSCAVLDNGHGCGYLGMPGVFVITDSCILHGKFWKPATKPI